jgi:hypothetical protein
VQGLTMERVARGLIGPEGLKAPPAS